MLSVYQLENQTSIQQAANTGVERPRDLSSTVNSVENLPSPHVDAGIFHEPQTAPRLGSRPDDRRHPVWPITNRSKHSDVAIRGKGRPVGS